MSEEKPKEFWALDSEGVPFKKGWYYRAFDFQAFMRKIEEDPRGGEVIGMEFDGKNVQFYTKASKEQMLEEMKPERET